MSVTSKRKLSSVSTKAVKRTKFSENDALLVELLRRKGFDVEFLAPSSWIVVVPNFLPPASQEEYNELWEQHPTDFKKIKMFGKEVEIPRYQQAYGRSYRYSGIESEALDETLLVNRLQGKMNELIAFDEECSGPFVFNMCLCNWYEPDHYIGPHSDDTRQLVAKSPIAGLSWGSARVFTLTAKTKKATAQEPEIVLSKRIIMNSGDLILMGGDCQETHKHEIEKLKKGETRGNRVSFTFRCFE